MTLQDLGALGELVGAVAVVVSLVYVAHQIRQSSRQIEINSRHVKASMYHATNENFVRWFELLAQDGELASLWRRAARGEELAGDERQRHQALMAMLLLAYESNFEQLRLGTVERDSLRVAGSDLVRLLASPAGSAWWTRRAPTLLRSDFRQAVEAVVNEHESATAAPPPEADG